MVRRWTVNLTVPRKNIPEVVRASSLVCRASATVALLGVRPLPEDYWRHWSGIFLGGRVAELRTEVLVYAVLVGFLSAAFGLEISTAIRVRDAFADLGVPRGGVAESRFVVIVGIGLLRRLSGLHEELVITTVLLPSLSGLASFSPLPDPQ